MRRSVCNTVGYSNLPVHLQSVICRRLVTEHQSLLKRDVRRHIHQSCEEESPGTH